MAHPHFSSCLKPFCSWKQLKSHPPIPLLSKCLHWKRHLKSVAMEFQVSSHLHFEPLCKKQQPWKSWSTKQKALLVLSVTPPRWSTPSLHSPPHLIPSSLHSLNSTWHVPPSSCSSSPCGVHVGEPVASVQSVATCCQPSTPLPGATGSSSVFPVEWVRAWVSGQVGNGSKKAAADVAYVWRDFNQIYCCNSFGPDRLTSTVVM